MIKTFVRSILPDGTIECSWYDKNGRRYLHRKTRLKWDETTVPIADNKYGEMAYAKSHYFQIFDNYLGKHPSRI